MLRVILVIALVVVALAPVAVAEPCSDSSALRAELLRESRRVQQWKWAWRITYTTLAVAQFAVAASDSVSRDDKQSLWVGGVKSSIAALGQWTSPLRIHVPPPTGDACTDRSQLRYVAERAAADERIVFWTGHIGGPIINLGGAAVIASRVSWQAGLLSFATGYAVGLLNTYTMPRASWGRIREPAWTAGLVTGEGRYSLVVTGSF